MKDCKKENVSAEREEDVEKRNEGREKDGPEVDRKDEDEDESKDVGSMGSPRVSGSDQADRISVGSNTVKSGINNIMIKHNSSKKRIILLVI